MWYRSSCRDSTKTNPTRIHEDADSISGLTPWVKLSGIAMSCGVGCRPGSDLVLLCLWCRPAATALIRPLAWEPPYAAGMDLKRKKKVVHIYNGILLSHKKNQNNAICSNMDGHRDYHTKGSQKDKYHMMSLILESKV